MEAKLLVVIGKTTKREVALQLPAVLGRSREADITVAHPLISRRHCEISEDNGLLVLRDLSSLNGTMIGGHRVEFAALLPDAEFTIGPLTFRVVYEYDGDLESVPETRFAAAAEGAADAGLGGPISAGGEEEPMFEIDEPMPAEPADESLSGELAMPDLMALADADPEDVFPAAPAFPPPASPAATTGTVQWQPVADDRLPTVPMTDALDDPMEVDSSLQSGGVGKESPWAAGPQATEEPQPAPTAHPPKRPTEGDEMDPEFGSFLEGLE